MTATIIPLRRTPEPVPAHPTLGVVEAALQQAGQAADSSSEQILAILSNLRGRQDELLTILANMRGLDLSQHPRFGSVVEGLDATTCQTLAEIGLLIRRAEHLAACVHTRS